MITTFLSSADFGSNTYLIESTANILIDAGSLTKRLKEKLKKISLDAIFLTHGHFDHIKELSAIKSLQPKTPIYCAEDRDFLLSPSKNGAHFFHVTFPSFSGNFLSLKEEVIKIKGCSIQVYLFPGHTPGGAGFYFSDENAFFLGDTVLGDSVGRTDLYGGSNHQLMESLKKISLLPIKENTLCYFGHGESMLFCDILRENPYLNF